MRLWRYLGLTFFNPQNRLNMAKNNIVWITALLLVLASNGCGLLVGTLMQRDVYSSGERQAVRRAEHEYRRERHEGKLALWKQSPIFPAVESNSLKRVEAELKADPMQINARDRTSSTPLHYAAKQNAKDIAERLIVNGADVNARDWYGSTPLHWAARFGHKDVAKLLIARGADLNMQAKYYGGTPLHFAAHSGSKGVAELLLLGGADVNAEDSSGRTPLDTALEAFKTHIADLIRSHGGKTRAELKAEKK
jgi:hypothetical protein